MKIILAPAILLGALTACGTSSDKTPTAPMVSDMKIVSADLAAVVITQPNDSRLTINDRQSCQALLAFLSTFKPDWKIRNSYAGLPAEQTSWRTSSTASDRYYVTYPTEMQNIDFTVERDSEKVLISCAIPQKWKTIFYRDASFHYPASLQSYRSEDQANPGTLQNGSKGGFAFVKAVGLGYQPRLTWALVPNARTDQEVRNLVQADQPWLAEESMLVDQRDLIDNKIASPVEIFSFSFGKTFNFDKLFLKPSNVSTLPIEFQILGSYFDPAYYDFSVSEPNAAITRNGKGGFDTKVMMDARTLKPIDCLKSGSVSDPKSCQYRNKEEIFKYFTHLFDRNETIPGSACVMGYFKLHSDLTAGGLVKVICIDRDGVQTIAYNQTAKYIVDAIAELNGRAVAETDKERLDHASE